MKSRDDSAGEPLGFGDFRVDETPDGFVLTQLRKSLAEFSLLALDENRVSN